MAQPGDGTLQGRGSLPVTLGVTALLLGAALAVTWLAGGTRTTAPHAFYIPILFAASRRNLPFTVGVAVVAGLLNGTVPLDVASRTPQEWQVWPWRLPFYVGIGAIVTVMLQRVDRATEAERELAQQRETMLQVIDHELRTPTTVLRGGAELLKSPEDLGEQSAEALLEAMRRATFRLEGLATVVAAVANGDTGPETWQDITPAEVLTRALRSLPARREADRSRIQLGRMPDVTLHTQPEHLKTALVCLLDNALRFSPAASPVDVEVAAEPGVCRISIRDHGDGLPDGSVEHLFTAFRQGQVTATRDYEGMGLGLHAARRIAIDLGGEVTLGPAPDGRGAVATVLLPVDDVPAPSAGAYATRA